MTSNQENEAANNDELNGGEKIKETQVPKGAPKKKNKIPPVRRLWQDHIQRTIAWCVAVVSLLFACVMMYLTYAEVNKKMRVMVIDSADTVHLGVASKVNLKSPLFESVAIWGTQALLQRSPVGYDLPEMLDALFTKDARKKANESLSAQMQDIEERSIHQKPEISKYTALKEEGDTRLIKVEGSVIRTGNYDDVPISESQPFELLMEIVRNPNLNSRKQYPYLVKNFKITYYRKNE